MKRKALLAASLLLMTMLFLNGCAPKETHYDLVDQKDYHVSVRYDANGGFFAENTTVITDSYNVSAIETNDQGKVDIALLPPDDIQRGKGNHFAPVKNGYFLAGWYSQRTEIQGDDGSVDYTYGGHWDFEKDLLSVDPKGEYSAADPVLTLYAVWVPAFQVEFYDVNSDELIETLTYNPTDASEIPIPTWNKETGMIDMEDFPTREGYTFNGVYYDQAGTIPVEGESLIHTGHLDYETGTAQNSTMKLYIDWIEGKWYHIDKAKQFKDIADLSGNYVLEGDLDFAGVNWSTTFMHQAFTGTIDGKGYSIKNVDLTQTDNNKLNAGLFGTISDKASICNVNFENISFTIKGGARKLGSNFGLFAGVISEGAVLDGVTVTNSTLKIDSKANFTVDDYSIGLLCGMGDPSVIDYSGITCTATGDAPETVTITVDGNAVTAEIIK